MNTQDLIDKMLSAFEHPIHKNELKLLVRLVEFSTESDEVCKYRLHLRFVFDVLFNVGFLVLVYYLLPRILQILYPGGITHV